MMIVHELRWIISFMLLTAAVAAQATPPSMTIRQGQFPSLQLGDAAPALKKFNPDFRLYSVGDFIPSYAKVFRTSTHDDQFISKWAQSSPDTSICGKLDEPSRKALPMAVVGDFNGDGIDDVVVMGHDKFSQLVLAVLSGKNGYSVSVVDKSKYVAPSKSSYPPRIPSQEEDMDRQQGLTMALDIVPSKETIKKNAYFGRCELPSVKRFDTDALQISEYGTAYNRLYYAKKGERKLTQVQLKP